MEPKKVLRSHSFLCGLDDIILGYKGNTFIEEGFIYTPYIPIMIEGEFRPRRSIASRYARKIVNNSFYGIVSIEPSTQNTEI
jgi:hypothetical protein